MLHNATGKGIKNDNYNNLHSVSGDFFYDF